MGRSAKFRQVLGILVCLGVIDTGFAANADFQSFFFDACVNPTGELATRCGETNAGAGDLSGDSESSLNPTQTLGNSDPSINISRERGKDNRERLENLRGGNSLMLADEGALQTGPFSLLVNGRFTDFERDATLDDVERGFDGDGWTASLGFDYRFSDRAVGGVMLSYQDTDSTFDPENEGVNFTPAGDAGSMESDGYVIAIFGALNLTDNFYLEGSLGYGITDYTFERNSVFQESNRAVPQTNVSTTAETDGNEIWASLSGGYEINIGAVSIGPYAGLILTQTDIDGYTEVDLSNSGLNMQVSDTDLDSLLGQLGIRANYAFSASWGVIVPQVRAEYDYEFEDQTPIAGTIYVLDGDQNRYDLSGVERDDSFFDLGVSLVAIFQGGWSAYIDYSTIVDYDDFERDSFTLGLRKEF
jgi:uncharacterized protein YhjY with autotransporter beta-barrel domain